MCGSINNCTGSVGRYISNASYVRFPCPGSSYKVVCVIYLHRAPENQGMKKGRFDKQSSNANFQPTSIFLSFCYSPSDSSKSSSSLSSSFLFSLPLNLLFFYSIRFVLLRFTFLILLSVFSIFFFSHFFLFVFTLVSFPFCLLVFLLFHLFLDLRSSSSFSFFHFCISTFLLPHFFFFFFIISVFFQFFLVISSFTSFFLTVNEMTILKLLRTLKNARISYSHTVAKKELRHYHKSL